MAKHYYSTGNADKGLGPDPNAYPLPLNPTQAAAAAVTCMFLGKTFHQDDTICYQHGVWKCTPTGWEDQSTAC